MCTLCEVPRGYSSVHTFACGSASLVGPAIQLTIASFHIRSWRRGDPAVLHLQVSCEGVN